MPLAYCFTCTDTRNAFDGRRLLGGGPEPLLLQVVHEAALVQGEQGAVDRKTNSESIRERGGYKQC
jgi:hypothetical protein